MATRDGRRTGRLRSAAGRCGRSPPVTGDPGPPFPQFTTTVDDLDLHFYHVRSPHEGALPLLLTHGWPGSMAEFAKVMGPLADPSDPATRSTSSPRRCPGS